ncbi:hypothetical protein DXG58_27165, partial [Salmonella enterica]|nr:hypothetical protein [Salmonella enterica]
CEWHDYAGYLQYWLDLWIVTASPKRIHMVYRQADLRRNGSFASCLVRSDPITGQDGLRG